MAKTWSTIRVLAAGALSFPIYCSASDSNDQILYNNLNDCIDLQFELAPAPDSFSEIDLASVCPELLLSLSDSVWVDRTLLANHDHPNLAQLADLRYFLLGIFSHPESGQALDFSQLKTILANSLDAADNDQGQNWWERLLSWLRQRHKGQDDVDLNWLKDWLEKITLSETTAETVAYSVSTLLILLAIGFVINEVRLARQGKSAPRSRKTTHRTPMRTPSGEPPDTLHLPREIPDLLNVCIDFLIRNQRLPEVRSRTNREFLRHLHHSGDNAAISFDHLLQQAECVLYGDRQINRQVRQQCRLEAATLLGTTSSDMDR